MKIVRSSCNFEREPLLAPFGFKGGYISELWQSIAMLENAAGQRSIGLGTQSVLWSDIAIFRNFPESVGNNMMFLITSYALKTSQKLSWKNPIDLFEQILLTTYEYAKSITAQPALRLTFVLNALVAVDNAAWLLYCLEKNITSFDEMVPEDIKPALSHHHGKLACIPLMTYGVPIDKIVEAVNNGYFILKIKNSR